ncbi:hypothetical protein CLV91_0727 [Maribacter vaceletii]|uniref:SusE-like outer membrane protein n=1 Tax=Maribacter vaceletii TaxID=1206816 RepID=A0A495EDF2_9FLAO|nr:hypothetical protein [Maribacter vaceletii]RKR14649.1 hypothetical protein CLV91_0727 [Maribacter vaceletii]
MKKYILIFSSLLCLLHYSCKGEFEEATFAINLKYPDQDSNCEEGTDNGNSITIPFKWEIQGDLTTYTLILNNTPFPIENYDKDDDGVLTFQQALEYNKKYEWQIISENVKSDLRSFRTPIEGNNNNNVPLAVLFKAPTYQQLGNSMEVSFEWEGGDIDFDGSLRYDAYWSTKADISVTINDGGNTNLTSPNTKFSIPNFDPNKDYYILVIAKDGENSASSILKFSQF